MRESDSEPCSGEVKLFYLTARYKYRFLENDIHNPFEYSIICEYLMIVFGDFGFAS